MVSPRKPARLHRPRGHIATIGADGHARRSVGALRGHTVAWAHSPSSSCSPRSEVFWCLPLLGRRHIVLGRETEDFQVVGTTLAGRFAAVITESGDKGAQGCERHGGLASTAGSDVSAVHGRWPDHLPEHVPVSRGRRNAAAVLHRSTVGHEHLDRGPRAGDDSRRRAQLSDRNVLHWGRRRRRVHHQQPTRRACRLELHATHRRKPSAD